MKTKSGFRGYVSSRAVRDVRYPQRLQNLAIREHAKRNGLTYLLSSTEFAMPGCYMMLDDLITELETLNGIILFSVFMLPGSRERRFQIYESVLSQQCAMHAALEDMVLTSEADIESFEDVIQVAKSLSQAPLNDVYQTFNLKMNEQDHFVKAIFKAL